VPKRRLPVRVASGPRREYVFSQQASIHDVKAHLEQTLRKELAALKPDTILNRTVDEIVDDFVARYTMNVPVLNKDAISEMPREDVQMEVPRVSQNRVFSGPGPFFIPATLFTLRIPFDGDRNLLRYPASGLVAIFLRNWPRMPSF
jgi:hypothetical protein